MKFIPTLFLILSILALSAVFLGLFVIIGGNRGDHTFAESALLYGFISFIHCLAMYVITKACVTYIEKKQN